MDRLLTQLLGGVLNEPEEVVVVAPPPLPGGSTAVSQVDETSFVEGVSSFNPIGGVLNELIDSDPTEDQAAAARITPKRAFHVNLRNQSGAETGIGANPLKTDVTTWLGSTAPTVGQKIMASSVPVVISSDQSPIPISGTITATDASVGLTGAVVPGSTQQNGGTDGANLQVNHMFDLDTGGGTEYNLGISLRKAALGGSVELGTTTNPIRIDPTGTTTQPVSAVSLPLPAGAATETTLLTLLTQGQLETELDEKFGDLGQSTMAGSAPVVIASNQSVIPVSDNAGSLTIDTPQLPAALVGGRLDENIGAWLGSTAPTVGQKVMASSVPVVLSSDQTTIAVSAVSLPLPTGAATEATLLAQTIVDNAVFTDGTTRVTPAGFILDEVAGIALTEDDAAAARIDSKRAQVLVIEDTTTRGQRLIITAANAAKVDGSAVTQPISAVSLPLPTGAATSANQTTLGSQTTKINDGTNTATVKAASTAAVTTDTALVVAISPNNTVNVLQAKSSTATRTDVASSASSVTLWAANTSRLGATIYNDSNKILYVKFGTTASTTDFTVLMDAGDYYEVPFSYTGRIDGIWSGANGSARLTELT